MFLRREACVQGQASTFMDVLATCFLYIHKWALFMHKHPVSEVPNQLIRQPFTHLTCLHLVTTLERGCAWKMLIGVVLVTLFALDLHH